MTVIGGADGPTAIFVASNSVFLFAAVAVLAVVLVAVVVIVHKKRRK